jgi:hypothetical protein
VHPSLRGQDLSARMIVHTLTRMGGTVAVSEDAFAGLPAFETYAARLGENVYEQYGAAHTMRVLARIPFFQETNPGFLARADGVCRQIAAGQPEAVALAMEEWQKPGMHGGGEVRPISGVVARVLVQGGEHAPAESLFDFAARSVSLYSSWNLEFTYFKLACRERVRGGLSEADRAEALGAAERGRFLLGQGRSGTGQTERYVGRLHQLRREYEEAIPFLVTAREKLTGMDLVSNDLALVESYVQTGRVDKARELVKLGIDNSGEFADFYRRMMSRLATPQRGAPATTSPPP